MANNSEQGGGPEIGVEARRLIVGCRDLLRDHLKALVAPAVEATREAMLDAAERARNTQEQARLVSGFNLLRRHRDDLEARLARLVEESFHQCFGDASIPESPEPEAGSLQLVAEDELSTSLAADQLCHRLELRYAQELHALRRRLAVLNGGRAIGGEANPFGGHQLSRGLMFATEAVPIEPEDRVRLIRTFEQLMLERIKDTFSEANELLRSAGVLPNLRFEYERPENDTAPSPSSEEPETPAAPDPADEATAEAAAPQGAAVERADELTREVHVESQELVSRIGALLDRMRDTSGRKPLPAEQRAAPAEMGAALTELQGQYSPERGEVLGTDAIKKRLATALSRRGKSMGVQEERTVELLGMVYEYLREEMAVIDSVKNLFEQLQVPLLRVALSDEDFFAKEDHPARQFFNTLSEAGEHWLGDNPEKSPLLSRLKTAVADVARADEHGEGGFKDRLDELNRHISQARRKADLAERRQIEARKGKEKLHLARVRAQEITSQLVKKYDPPEFARPLIEEAWADYLALLFLRFGEDSEQWQQAVMVIRFIAVALRGRLSGALVEQLNTRLPGMLEQLSAGLGQVGYTPQAAADAAERVGEAIRWKLAEGAEEDRPAVMDEPIPDPVAGQRDRDGGVTTSRKEAEADLSEGERSALAALRLTRFGTWFELQGDRPDKWLRRKLSWFSPVTGHCLLTDNLGHATEITLVDLAKRMSAGTARAYERQGTPMIDRALRAVFDRLRRLAGASGEASPAGQEG